ncbi:hypothetical protein ILYODFUR_022155, partial [Ilyodon furcidens]
MDSQAVFEALYSVCEENVTFFSGGTKGTQGDAGQRLVEVMKRIQDHARSLEPVISGFAAVYHHFDFDPHIPANGYRSLVKVVRCCLLHIIHKGRYITTNRRSIFFRVAHNAGEMEAYCNALCQLRALLYLAQRMLHDNSHGNLFFQDESGLSESFIREYASMHKGCFYGRCLGFQFTPAIRPCLQTIAIGLVAFGENYKRHQSGIGQHCLIIQLSFKHHFHLSSHLCSIPPWPLTVHLFDVVCLDFRCSFILLQTQGLTGVFLVYFRIF